MKKGAYTGALHVIDLFESDVAEGLPLTRACYDPLGAELPFITRSSVSFATTSMVSSLALA